MKSTSNIFLIGPMGTGKSTIGRKLAKRSSQMFYDSDYEIENRTGVKINLIFEIEGEAGFRKRESQLLDEFTSMSNIVLATGGGAVLSEENRATLIERGFVVYLKSDIDLLLKRTSRDSKRPLLQNEDPEAVLKKLLDERGPLYEEVADLVIDTAGLSINDIIMQIMSADK
ncbi:MAG: shikimate kinase AroK [Proteobacteria bacterium]|nr:shikimate kinase AroK [Pseudomonadota bacterium]